MSGRRLVHIVDDVPELTGAEGPEEGPVLVMALDGFLDAGNASALAVAHLVAHDAGRVVASFDIDELHDYRARRPPLSFRHDRYTDYEAPRLNVRLVHDAAGEPFLLLAGPEPDIRWEGFASAVREVVEHFNVRLTAAIGSVPMAVPHTRPVQLTQHTTDSDLMIQENVWSGDIRVPASAQALVELRLGEAGHDAGGFVAHIPHYLAQFDYPRAASTLLAGIAEVTGLIWDLTALDAAAEQRALEIEEQISDSEDVRDVVAGLEQQYDAFHAGTAESLLADDHPLPSGEELGAQFERFLAGLDTPEED